MFKQTSNLRAPARICWRATVASIGLVAACAMPARATEVVFTIDPAQSGHDLSAVDTSSVDPHGTYVPTSPGSMSTTLSGNFVVDFDPTTNTPTSLSFKGGQGYFRFNSSLSAHTADGQLTIDFTPVTWDFDDTVTKTGGVFPAIQNTFTLLGGSLTRTIHTAQFPNSSITTTFSGGAPATPNGGQWSIANTGAGDWTLSLVGGLYQSTYGAFGTSGSMTHSVHAVATAHYGVGNAAAVPPAAPGADALGGASTVGGVSINFNDATSGGTFSVQQLPNQTSLDQTAIAAAQANPVFALSTSTLSTSPQIWAVNYDGTIGAAATLVFAYDPTLLPVGFDQSTLGIWHFNKLTSEWEFGGQVNTLDHTITFQTTSFSPFQLGAAVPEPSSIALAACGLLGLIGYVWRRRGPAAR
ncbi:MAG TPA: PEP-CTERM sorting domain-containing protein [Pirellulales bacterium]|nr:PEP-CTERM sorting domain-containing protein [Pirellulales bacterium]